MLGAENNEDNMQSYHLNLDQNDYFPFFSINEQNFNNQELKLIYEENMLYTFPIINIFKKKILFLIYKRLKIKRKIELIISAQKNKKIKILMILSPKLKSFPQTYYQILFIEKMHTINILKLI